MMPTIARPYRSAPIAPDPRIIRGTSRWGLCISSDAPLGRLHNKTTNYAQPVKGGGEHGFVHVLVSVGQGRQQELGAAPRQERRQASMVRRIIVIRHSRPNSNQLS